MRIGRDIECRSYSTDHVCGREAFRRRNKKARQNNEAGEEGKLVPRHVLPVSHKSN